MVALENSAEFVVRPAQPQDVSLILSFIRELAEYESLSHEVVANEALLAETLFGANAGVEVLVAFAGEEPAGFALFFQNFSTFLGRPGIYLEDLFVRPHLRGRGIGRALLSRVATLAMERHCGRLEWAVLDWNEPAIRFYESLGAKPMNEWTVYRVTGAALEGLAQGAD